MEEKRFTTGRNDIESVNTSLGELKKNFLGLEIIKKKKSHERYLEC